MGMSPDECIFKCYIEALRQAVEMKKKWKVDGANQKNSLLINDEQLSKDSFK